MTRYLLPSAVLLSNKCLFQMNYYYPYKLWLYCKKKSLDNCYNYINFSFFCHVQKVVAKWLKVDLLWLKSCLSDILSRCETDVVMQNKSTVQPSSPSVNLLVLQYFFSAKMMKTMHTAVSYFVVNMQVLMWAVETAQLWKHRRECEAAFICDFLRNIQSSVLLGIRLLVQQINILTDFYSPKIKDFLWAHSLNSELLKHKAYG